LFALVFLESGHQVSSGQGRLVLNKLVMNLARLEVNDNLLARQHNSQGLIQAGSKIEFVLILIVRGQIKLHSFLLFYVVTGSIRG
jgi:hypothetical protein